MNIRKVVSLNLSGLQPMEYSGNIIYTGIFKSPVPGPVTVRTLTIDGDSQADLVNHGGLDKAVYCYPQEHYGYWSGILGTKELSPGALGENFTTIGILEDEAFIGDRWKLGTAIFEITQPRSPCYKLAQKFQRADLVARFLEADKPGFYASVIEEGIVAEGDELIPVSRAKERISVRDVFRLAVGFDSAPDLRRSIVSSERIPDFWRRKVLAHGGDGLISS
jgi:MOSC domain-containing protein YiiM